MLLRLYGAEAQSRAVQWHEDGQLFWCGGDVGEMLYDAGLPNACPGSSEATTLFAAGLSAQGLYNDNDAHCAFAEAASAAPTCAMAYLGIALANGQGIFGPQHPKTEPMVREALGTAGELLEAGGEQHPAAKALYEALRVRACADGGVPPTCGPESLDFGVRMAALGAAHPDLPGVQYLAANAVLHANLWDDPSVLNASFAGSSMPDNTQSSDALKVPIARGLNIDPEQPALRHLEVHWSDKQPDAYVGERAARSLNATAATVSMGGSHAQHMIAHDLSRLGDYEAGDFYANARAFGQDAEWSLRRGGGWLPDSLFDFTSHNTAMAVLAAQRMGSWRRVAASMAALSANAAFHALFSIGVGGGVGVQELALLTHQLLEPLRFGKYEEVLASTAPGVAGSPFARTQCGDAGGMCPVIRLTPPGGSAADVVEAPCPSCGVRLSFARCVAASRLGRADETLRELLALVGVFGREATPETAIAAAEAEADVQRASAHGDAVLLLVAAAEVAGSGADEAVRLLRKAVAVQAEGPSSHVVPCSAQGFFYPVRETLAGALLARGDAGVAAAELQAVLRDWPSSALAAVGYAEALRRSGGEAAASEAQGLLKRALRYNDTELDIAWL